MASKNICASCIGVNVTEIVETDNTKLPRWLESIDYVSNFIDSVPLKKYKMSDYSVKLNLNVGKNKANKLMLYWGAQSSDKIVIDDAFDAYGDFSNYGVTRVNSEGNVTLYFSCPQPYSTIEMGETQRETFYRHIHFCFSDKSMKNWLAKVYTKIVVCNMKILELISKHKNGEILLINTLPASNYDKNHIPNSYNLHHNDINIMSREELIEWMNIVIEDNYPVLDKLIKNGQLEVYELPIVVYCANKKCNLSQKAAIELYNKGFVNVRDFEDGMRGYNNYVKN